MQACLIETINPDDLLKIIQKGVRRPKEKVEESSASVVFNFPSFSRTVSYSRFCLIVQRNNDDAEIQMGASSMSLKCPVSESLRFLQLNPSSDTAPASFPTFA